MTAPTPSPQDGPALDVGTCKSCHAPILWAHTTKGHRIPLDPTPVGHPAGNLLFDGSFTRRPTVRTVRPADLPTRPLIYASHFVTCPNAVQHRHKRAQATTRKGPEA